MGQDNTLPSFQEHIIVEATIDGWTIAQTSSIMSLHGFTKHVGAGVPENLLPFIISEFQQFYFAVLLQRAVQIPKDAIHFGYDRIVCQSLTALQDKIINVQWTPAIVGNQSVIQCENLQNVPYMFLGIHDKQISQC